MTKESTIMIAPSLQKKVLLLLVILWVPLLVYFWGPDIYNFFLGSKETKALPPGVAAAPGVRKNSPPRPAKSKTRGELDLALWERKQEPLRTGTQNPFHPLAGYFEPPPPPPGSKPKAALPPPPDPFIEELKTFKYFGYAEDQSKKVAFLGKGNRSYTAKENDIIDNQFLVKKITEDYVVLGEPQGPKELTIAQSGFGEGGAGGSSPPRFTPSAPPGARPFPPPSTPVAPMPPLIPQDRHGLRERPSFPVPPQDPLSKGGK